MNTNAEISTIESLQLQSELVNGIITLRSVMCLEWLQNLDLEILVVWNSSWSPLKVLYLLTRYSPLLCWPVFYYFLFGSQGVNLSTCKALIRYIFYAVFPPNTIGIGCIVQAQTGTYEALAWIFLLISVFWNFLLILIPGVSSLKQGSSRSRLGKIVYTNGIIYYIYIFGELQSITIIKLHHAGLDIYGDDQLPDIDCLHATNIQPTFKRIPESPFYIVLYKSALGTMCVERYTQQSASYRAALDSEVSLLPYLRREKMPVVVSIEPLLQELDKILSIWRQVNNLLVSSLAILTLDWFLTLSSEVLLIWSSSWTTVKVLFLVARYVPFTYIALLLYHQFGSHSLKSSSACPVLFGLISCFWLKTEMHGNLVLMIYRGISILRDGGPGSQLSTIVYGNGIIYYFYVFGLSLVNVMIIFIARDYYLLLMILPSEAKAHKEDVKKKRYFIQLRVILLGTEVMGVHTTTTFFKIRPRVPKIAFLSACQTATRESSLPHESIHLAAGFVAAGFKGVIVTLWCIDYKDALGVVKDTYEVMKTPEGGLDIAMAADGLDWAVKRMRKAGVPPHHWVPFIHVGV
ncbi:hypothetical protein NP233_g7665 [Leucocoprinus birnbaumii]|uniref:CHAT domain-containing protein n=1 Tax=Leucocoprinus birnbaumii TaxID=56174 RepID=A0AAD5VNV6_9AGAR|nr:hypothetical protein NP233_g7665 [Leucocoprinus birnbaumii]